jgi:riboflavin kinase/FMN adenylyltransferase
MAPDRFAHLALVEKLHAVGVIVGANFRFGHKAAGDVALLQRLGQNFGFTATGVPLLTEDDTVLSATYVRTCVQAGDMRSAAQALGRPHRLDGVVERGDQRGRDLGFPTANLRTEQWAAVPADGVYAGRVVRLDEWGRTRDVLGMAAISVGTNPTFEVRQRRVEAYVLDFEGDLYGQGIGVEFVERLRGMVKFDGLEPLIEQMTDDVRRTRELLIP